MEHDMLVMYGSEVKALGEGKVAGYLVRFSGPKDPDLQGDFFTKDTFFGPHTTTPVLYHHGLDPHIKGRTLGQGTLKYDDVGAWIEAQLDMRDDYEKAVYELAEKGKLGWSSGTASHLVEREPIGKAWWIKSWPLGLDGSLTPTPAEPRNVAISLKSIQVDPLEVVPESVPDAGTTEEKPQTEQPPKAPEEQDMTPEEVKAMVDAGFKARQEAEAKAKAEAEAREAEIKARVDDEIKNLVVQNPGLKLGAPSLNLKAPKGDTAQKALSHWIRTGDNGGLRADPQYKTNYELIEGTQYQGQEFVPAVVANTIYELRDPQSIARAAGSQVWQVTTGPTINIPVEKNRQGVLVAPGEKTAYDQLEAQIFDKKAVTITKYTRNIPISEELIEDTQVDFMPFLTRSTARALALTENAHFISDATGAWYNSALGTRAASTSAITIAEVMGHLYSMAAEYRNGAAWVMNRATEAYIRGLNSAYTFPFEGNGGASGFTGRGGLDFGTGTLMGLPVYNDEVIEAMGTASYRPVLLANFAAGYAIVERRPLTIRRDDITGQGSGLIYLWVSSRIGGTITTTEALKHIAQATA